MKFLAILIPLTLLISLGEGQMPTMNSKLVCFYDSTSFIREGYGKFILQDLEPALQFCTHLVYGCAGINAESHKLVSLNENLDLDHGKGHYRLITSLKRKYPQVKFLLGLGGGYDKDQSPEKYLNLLESSSGRIAFINSAHSMLKTYDFDGLDLGWQFPENKPKKHHSGIGKLWKGFKKVFTGDSVLDEKAAEHKEEFTLLVRDLKNSFRHEGYLLSMTVLPNVNTTLFYDVGSIINYLDFVNLAAFDWNTPIRYDYQADYSAPLYEVNDRHPEHNINSQVQLWLDQKCPASKINVGITTYGWAWTMTSNSGLTGHPPITDTKNEVAAGLQSLRPGLLSYPEICEKLQNPSNSHLKGAEQPLRKVTDPTKRHGTYAYRTADESGNYGVWVSYEDPETASNKGTYIRTKGLGGAAFFDVSFDDFRGSCSGDKYPILRALRFRL